MTDNDEREGITHLVKIGGMNGYITVNPSDDGGVYEIFVHGFGKMGSTMQGWTNAFAVMMSLGLQNGLDLEKFAPLLVQMKFDPSGETNNPDIPECHSIPDYIAQWLVRRHGSRELQHRVAQIRTAVRQHRPPVLKD